MLSRLLRIHPRLKSIHSIVNNDIPLYTGIIPHVLKEQKRSNSKMTDLPTGFGKNQLHEASKDKEKTDELLTDSKSRFDNIDYSFGYGSKIFSQGNKVDISDSQIDMIYAVNDSKRWHAQNIVKNAQDYSFLKYCGVNAIKMVEELGAGIYFNPFIDVALKNGKSIELKYGVTTIDAVKKDLKTWDTMYIAGRLHKPVAILDNHPQLTILNQFNLMNAVKLALLLHDKKSITEKDLYLIIAGLSYMGDPRMKVKAENPDKILNIVDNQMELFQNLYEPIFGYIPHLLNVESVGENGKVFNIKLDEETVGKTLLELPISFRNRFFENYPNVEDIIICNAANEQKQLKQLSYQELTEAKADEYQSIDFNQREYVPSGLKYSMSPITQAIGREFIVSPERVQGFLKNAVETTVGSGALVQSVKGILTAGVVRSYKYAVAKRAKFNRSQMKNK